VAATVGFARRSGLAQQLSLIEVEPVKDPGGKDL